MSAGATLSRSQKVVLTAAFVPMVGTGVAGGIGTYANISTAYGSGTAVGAVAAGEGATAVLALVLLGLTMLGQSSPTVIRLGLWALPAAASAMSAMAAKTPGEVVIYALTPMGMTTAAEGAAFLARRIVVHRDGRDVEAERQAAAVVQALAYQWARAESHPDRKVRAKSQKTAWKLARKVGIGDTSLGDRLLDVQRDRVTAGADAVLRQMFTAPDHPALAAAPAAAPDGQESSDSGTERSTSDQPVPAPVSVTAGPEPVDSVPAVRPLVHAVAAEQPRQRRATGRVPESARSARPKRTEAELLIEARSATAGWSIDALTAEGIRKELRTSPTRARVLRDTLRGERAPGALPETG
ncbi:conjugal transfer protein [Streptomyces zhihengii]|uniref:conjugal transfer protein n=1 Tax=Streptomyces zhihengii TaxID=1818004 RepID=UPI0036371715